MQRSTLRIPSRRLTVLALAALLLGGLFVAGAAQAQDISIGTYDPQQVATAAGVQQMMMERMSGLQQRAQAAQQSGDQAAMQQIQQEAQQIQQEVFETFSTDVESVLPGVADETGVSVIATEVGFTAEGVTTVDVTEQVVAALQAMKGGATESSDDAASDGGESGGGE